VCTIKILRRGLKSLDKLDVAEEAERLAMAKALVPTNNFNFFKILLNLIVEAIFWASLNNTNKTP
jgi:hypothetical protein